MAIEAGAVVVDNSSAFRMDPDTPLVVPEVNPQAARGAPRADREPQLLDDAARAGAACRCTQESPLERVIISTYQSVSGTGQKAIDALRREAAETLAGRTPEAGVYPHPIAFNALPFAGSWQGDDGYTDEELKLVNESRKILGLPDLRVSATCVRVPVVTSHSEAVWVETRRADRARARARAARGRARRDGRRRPRRATSTRWRSRPPATTTSSSGASGATSATERSLALWIVSDNLRKGAATNAVQIAELLLRDGLVRAAA